MPAGGSRKRVKSPAKRKRPPGPSPERTSTEKDSASLDESRLSPLAKTGRGGRALVSCHLCPRTDLRLGVSGNYKGCEAVACPCGDNFICLDCLGLSVRDCTATLSQVFESPFFSVSCPAQGLSEGADCGGVSSSVRLEKRLSTLVEEKIEAALAPLHAFLAPVSSPPSAQPKQPPSTYASAASRGLQAPSAPNCADRPPTLSSVVRDSVRAVREEEETSTRREASILIAGMPSLDQSQPIGAAAADVLAATDCPSIWRMVEVRPSLRRGKQPPSKEDSQEILVRLESPAQAKAILLAARNLKGHPQYTKTYLRPLRSRQERSDLRALYIQKETLKEAEEDSTVSYRVNHWLMSVQRLRSGALDKGWKAPPPPPAPKRARSSKSTTADGGKEGPPESLSEPMLEGGSWAEETAATLAGEKTAEGPMSDRPPPPPPTPNA